MSWIEKAFSLWRIGVDLCEEAAVVVVDAERNSGEDSTVFISS